MKKLLVFGVPTGKGNGEKAYADVTAFFRTASVAQMEAAIVDGDFSAMRDAPTFVGTGSRDTVLGALRGPKLYEWLREERPEALYSTRISCAL